MSDPVDRRGFAASFAATVVLGREVLSADTPAAAPMPAGVPVEAAFDRDYPPPNFQPSWKKPQINRRLVADFVVYAHMDLDMVKRLLEKEPALVNAMMDWGGGDWESGLGGASHMGRRDIVETTSLGVTWEPRCWVTVTGGIRGERYRSTEPNTSFRNTAVTLGARLNF